ncbi:MAG: hypothetical protein V4697_01305 [Patescibacteria group bacterium]
MKLKNIIRTSVILSIAFFSLSTFVYAAPYQVEQLPDKTVYNDFVVGPGKYQVELKPGQSKVVNVIVSNRLGKDKAFQIQVEDFKGSRDPLKPVILLDGERGPYSLKDYLKFGSTTFMVNHAERVTIPVTVSIPSDAQPGGLYGSVIISTVTTAQEQVLEGESSAGANPIVTRIGSLFFIKIAGDVKEDLVLKDFSLADHAWLLSGGSVSFQLLYENNGTVHENPYGFIRVKNMFGSEIAKIEVEPWFLLPDSTRLREVAWETPFLFGRYVATADIAKGYGGEKDLATVAFWVLPWKIIGLVFIVIVVIVLAVRWIASKFTISFKK